LTLWVDYVLDPTRARKEFPYMEIKVYWDLFPKAIRYFNKKGGEKL